VKFYKYIKSRDSITFFLFAFNQFLSHRSIKGLNAFIYEYMGHTHTHSMIEIIIYSIIVIKNYSKGFILKSITEICLTK